MSVTKELALKISLEIEKNLSLIKLKEIDAIKQFNNKVVSRNEFQFSFKEKLFSIIKLNTDGSLLNFEPKYAFLIFDGSTLTNKQTRIYPHAEISTLTPFTVDEKIEKILDNIWKHCLKLSSNTIEGLLGDEFFSK